MSLNQQNTVVRPSIPLRVLILEDSEADALLILRELKKGGYEPDFERVCTAGQTRDALRRGPWDVILSDNQMSGFDGLSGFAILKESGLDIPFILVSACMGEEPAAAAIKSGVSGYIDKRNLARLPSTVERELRDARERQGRKRAEEALRESEERFRQLAENITEVFWLTDPAKETMLYISPAYELIWGRTCESLYRTPASWAESIHPGDRERILRAAATRQSAGQYDETYRITRPDGSLRWIRDRAFPVRDKSGRVYRVVGTAQDITEHKRAELRIEVQHAVTAVLAEAAAFPETTRKVLALICGRLEWQVGCCWTLDRAAHCLRCVEVWHPSSTEFLEFAGLSRSLVFAIGECLPGQVWADGAAWIPDVTQLELFQRRAVASKLGLRGGVAFPIKIKGEVVGVIELFSARALPLDPELLAMFAALGAQLGQSLERKQLEEQFRQSQKMEAIGQLAGGVAHDFNNILTIIQGHAQLLLSTEGLLDGMAEDLQQIFLASERAARLTSQLLAFSRKQVMQLRSEDLNEIVAGMSKMLQRIIGEDVALRVEPSQSSRLVQADPGMLEQVLMNLAVNARDAMREGGILTVGVDRMEIGEQEAPGHPKGRVGVFVRLRVADTGCGMTPETLARIFEPFFTTKAPGKGTGLGLATVHGIVQQHQGWVEVQSQVGKGTAFHVYIPDAGPAAAAAAIEPALSRPRGGSETILLVEDEAGIRQLARTILERLGYRVLEAASGVAALSVWEKCGDQISLVITDMVLPDGMTGRELAARLTERRASLKVIYSTGYSPDGLDHDLNLEVGLNYLPKPYEPRALAQIVRKRLDT